MDVQAVTVLTTLKKPTATADAKLQQLNELKSAIKHLRVPAPAQATVFECVRLAIGSQTSPQLVPVGFSTLSHLIKRLGLQNDDAAIAGFGPKLLPVLVERLGDVRETHRAAASQALADIWIYASAEVERIVREHALSGLNARAREAGMIWVVHMHQKEGLQFRSFLPLVVAALEGADNQLRETAKASIVSLFSSAPARAKVDLKKQLAAHNVRKTTVSFILSKIDDAPAPPQSAPAIVEPAFLQQASSNSNNLTGFGNSISDDVAEPMSSTSIEPLYFHSQSEWDQLVRSMQPSFVGKETNENWEVRDQNVSRLRRAVKGNAPTDFPESFVSGIKIVLDGILKVADSLRTTVSSNGCHLVQELFRLLGPAMDPHAEIVLQTFTKLTASMKKINSINGGETTDIIFQTISYTQRSLQHVWFAATDKNVLLRSHAPIWLRTLVGKHKGHKAMLHNSGGVELVQKTLIKGLTDANPKVRETSRDTYRVVVSVWPEMAEPVLGTVSARDRHILESGPTGSGGVPMTRGSSAAGSSSSRSGKPTLREAIAAQKRSLAAKQAHPSIDRPASALSTLSPPAANRARYTSTNRPGPVGSSSVSSLPVGPNPGPVGSLMSGPARRPRRPEIVRPATADPYATRGVGKGTPFGSPMASPVVTMAPSLTNSTFSNSRSPPRMASSQSIPRHMASSSSFQSRERTASVASAAPAPPPASTRNRTPEVHIEPQIEEPRLQPDMLDIAMRDDMDLDDPVSHPESPTLPVDDVVPAGPIDLSLDLDLSAPQLSSSNQKEETRFDGSALKTVPSANLGVEVDIPTPPEPSTPVRSPASQTENTPVVQTVGSLKSEPSGIFHTPPPPKAPLAPVDMSALSIHDPREKLRGMEPNSSPSSRRDHPGLAVSTSGMNSSPTHGMDANRIRGLLSTAIDRLYARTLDPHGLRRIQDILRNPITSDVFAERPRLVSDLLLALLDLLESPQNRAFAAGKPTSRSRVSSLKTQTLSTIRVLVTVRQKDVLASPSDPGVNAGAFPQTGPALWVSILQSLARARRDYSDTEHAASEMWRMVTDICSVAPTRQLSDAILVMVNVLERVAPSAVPASDEGDDDQEGDARVAVTGLRILRLLVGRVPTATGSVPDPIPNPARLGQLVVSLLNSTNPDVRCDVLEFCLAFHRRLVAAAGGVVAPENGDMNETDYQRNQQRPKPAKPAGPATGLDFSSSPFWKVVSGVREQHLNLITYYIARNGVEG